MTELNVNIPGIKLLRLREEYIDGIVDLMNKEGWYYYDYHELERYIKLNQDCFVLLKEECVIGSIFTTNFGNQVWIGNIVVAQEHRGLGFAYNMIKAVIDYLRKEKNSCTFRLGSVPLAIGLYKKIGFRPEAFTTSQHADLPIKLEHEKLGWNKNISVERLNEHDLETIANIDLQYFKSDRLQLLSNLYEDSIKASCYCLKDQGKIVGFLMIRRRKTSKAEGQFAKGPDYAYRLGPSCIHPGYGIEGFKALLQEAIKAVNEEVNVLKGSAKIYATFPRNADRNNIYDETIQLAKAMETDSNISLDKVFDEHNHIFDAKKLTKSDEQWAYMKSLGFKQEYFEQIMSYSPEAQGVAERTKADPAGIFAAATPGDKG